LCRQVLIIINIHYIDIYFLLYVLFNISAYRFNIFNVCIFVPVSNTTWSNLSLVIIDTLKSIGIDLKYLKGQGYDGAACMSGKFNGVQQLIKNHYPQALYVHCSAHSFNLVVSTSCAMPPIRNAMGTFESVYCYLNTPKRYIF